jgi:hypothetical protein
MAHPPGIDTRARPYRATSGPSTSTLARIVFTSSYGASSLGFFFPLGDAICSARGPASSTVQPSIRNSLAMVFTSASCGTFFHVDVPVGSKAAASSGNAAFFAPLIGIFPTRRAPPSTTILSIASLRR